MPKNYNLTKKLQPMPQEKAYDQDKDLQGVLVDIVTKMREEANQAMYNDWGISPKELKSCSIKLFGSDPLHITLQVNESGGAYRLPQQNVNDLQLQSKGTLKLLEKFETALKKEFKARTKKTLKISKGKTDVNWEMVALNGLYQFVAIKQADVTTELDGQSWAKE